MLTVNCGPVRKARKCAAVATTMIAATLVINIASMGFAQSADTVTLRFAGNKSVTGELVEFSDNKFQLISSVGTITVPNEGVDCVGARCPEGTRLETSGDQLVLTSKDGSVTLTGDLIEIAENQYVLATDVGEVRVDINLVNCEGTSCITIVSEPEFGGPVVLTDGTTPISGNLVENLVDAYVVEVPNLGLLRISKDSYTCSGEGCP